VTPVQDDHQRGYRRASPEDLDHVTTVVALAFEHDPLWGRALARSDGRVDHHAEFWRLFVDGPVRQGTTWLTPRGEATSVWVGPGATELSADQEAQLETLARDRLGPGADTYFELLTRFEAAHPRTEPHYYLSLLATHPDHRGHGFGTTLLSFGLDRIDAEHLPVYLESSNPANDRRYQRLGFEQIGALGFPGERPSVATMWRTAR
jgi:GNAT superfamily N-acetyltransferase